MHDRRQELPGVRAHAREVAPPLQPRPGGVRAVRGRDRRLRRSRRGGVHLPGTGRPGSPPPRRVPLPLRRDGAVHGGEALPAPRAVRARARQGPVHRPGHLGLPPAGRAVRVARRVGRAADAAPDRPAGRREVSRRARHPALRHVQPRLPRHRRHAQRRAPARLVGRTLRVPVRLRHHARHVRRPALDGPGARPGRPRARHPRPGLERRVLEPQAPSPGRAARRAHRERKPRALLPLERVQPHAAHGAVEAPGPLPDDRDRAAAVDGPRVQRGAALRGLSDQHRLALLARLLQRRPSHLDRDARPVPPASRGNVPRPVRAGR